MACGYGACYGCAVEIDGELKRLCVEGPVSMRLLNASGCLDALTAPDVARELDAFVTKTVTPLPREGNPPVRIAETERRDAERDRAREPRDRRFLADHLPRLAELGVPLWVSVGGFQAHDFAELCARLDGRRSRRDRAEPLLPERGRGARERRRDRRGASARRRASRSTRSSRRPRPTSPRRHAPRRPREPTGSASSTRSAASRSTSGRSGRCWRAEPAGSPVRRCARSRSPPSTRAAERPICPSSAWAAWRPDGDALELLAAGANDVALGTTLFADPGAPARIRAELEAELAARGFVDPDNAVGRRPRGGESHPRSDSRELRRKKPCICG